MRKQGLAKYEVYKTSSINWLDELPNTWKIKRLKDIIENLESGVSVNAIDSPAEEGELGILKTSCVNGVGFKPTENKTIWKEERHRAKSNPRKGNLIVSRMNTPELVGASGFIDKDYPTLFLPDRLWQTVFYKNAKVCSKWLSYVLLAVRLKEIISFSSTGTSTSMKNLAQETFLSIAIPFPTCEEQKAIADYLDCKTAQIDKKIELLVQKATRYGRLKQSLINETVTRGLDKTVVMKDSRVNWIGEVPEHWSIERIGTAFEERREKVNDTEYPPLSVTMRGVVPQLDTAAKTDHNDNRKRVAINDFVINSRSDRRGSSGVSELNGSVSLINIVLSPRKGFYGKYLHHLFRSYRFVEEFYRVGRGIVDDLWTTNYSVMKAISFPFPDYEEQKAIADYLDEKTAKIDRIVETINTQIDKLKELRKTLINDVVIGKIKVTKEGVTV